MSICVVSKNESGEWESRKYNERDYRNLTLIPENVGYVSIIGYVAFVTSEFAREFNLREREQYSREEYSSCCYIECTSREVFNSMAQYVKELGNGDSWGAEIELLSKIRKITLECEDIHGNTYADGNEFYFIKNSV